MTARATSKITYHELKALGKVNEEERQIMEYLSIQSDPISRRQVAKALGKETSSVSGRVNSLVAKRYVKEEIEASPCPITGRGVYKISLFKD